MEVTTNKISKVGLDNWAAGSVSLDIRQIIEGKVSEAGLDERATIGYGFLDD